MSILRPNTIRSFSGTSLRTLFLDTTGYGKASSRCRRLPILRMTSRRWSLWMFRSTGAGAIRQILHLKIGGRTHRPNGTRLSCRWTMAIPSLSMETPPTNSQTFPRSQWADGRSSHVAKNSFQGKLKRPCVQPPRFFDRTPTISERTSRSAAHSLDSSLF